MPGHDPFRALSADAGAVAVADPPAALTGAAATRYTPPAGAVAKVTAWIDKGRGVAAKVGRAHAAIEAEDATGKPRKGVVDHARRVIAAHA